MKSGVYILVFVNSGV